MNARHFSAVFAAGVLGTASNAWACDWPVDDKQPSGDAHYQQAIACRQDVSDFFWTEYGFEQHEWDQEYGYSTPCDTRKPLARTYSALQALWSSHPDPIRSGTNYGSDPLRWAGQYTRNNINELDGRCTGESGEYAHTQHDVNDDGWADVLDEWTNLYKPFFFELSVPERAGTLVHEATHLAGYGHAPDGSCSRNTSCDWVYGQTNANTQQVWWLSAYATRAINGNWALRERARDRANAILDRGFVAVPPTRVEVFADQALVGKVNADAVSDIVIFRESDHTWHALDGAKLKVGQRVELISGHSFGAVRDKPLMADVDRDGRDELIRYRTRDPVDQDITLAEARWSAFSHAKNKLLFSNVTFGDPMQNDVPLLGDVNGDSAADVIIYRPADGTWHALDGKDLSALIRTPIPTLTGVPFGGLPGDLPLLGDFNADTNADLVIVRITADGLNLEWHGFRPATPSTPAAFLFGPITYGENGDIPFVADFDGDGKRDDIGIFRPRNGEWHSRSLEAHIFGPVTFGGLADRPLVGTFEAPSTRAGIVIYRPFEGTWHARNTQSPVVTFFAGTPFGQPF